MYGGVDFALSATSG